VYDARIKMQGSFAVPDETQLKNLIGDGQPMWDESYLVFGTTTNLTGLRAEDHVAINDADAPWQPCMEFVRDKRACGGGSLVVARAHLDAGAPPAGPISFNGSISLRGTTSFNVLYGGRELEATIRSTWTTPSFGGDVLPATSSVTAHGFEANWQAADFGAPRISTTASITDPAMWKGTNFGVDLIEAMPVYRMVNRVAKYCLLFVVLSFATYVCFELLSRLRIHVVQYGILGLSLSLFALLLLSLSEPIGYTAGYVVSAGLVLIQSTLYTAAVAKRAVPALVFAGVLAGLFAFIYVLLGLETYSLLIGALALFVVVSALMVITQTIRWPARGGNGTDAQPEAAAP
jgi:inner membrane protein